MLKSGNKLYLLCALLFVLILLSGCTQSEPPSETVAESAFPQESTLPVKETSVETEPTKETSVAVPESETSPEPYGRSVLTETQKKIYDTIAAEFGAEEIFFDEPQTYFDVYRAHFYFERDHRDGMSMYSTNNLDTPIYMIRLPDEMLNKYYDVGYGMNPHGWFADGDEPIPLDTPISSVYAWISTEGVLYERMEESKTAFKAVEERWLAELPGKEASDFEKVDALTKLMCRELSYGYKEPDDCPLGIINGQLICEGYATTFKYFADRIGLESLIVSGWVDELEEHSWNLVKVDGKWYHHDVTWIDHDDYMEYRHYLCSEDSLGRYGVNLYTINMENVFPDYPYPEAPDFYLFTVNERQKMTVHDSEENEYVLSLLLPPWSQLILSDQTISDQTDIYLRSRDGSSAGFFGSVQNHSVPTDDSGFEKSIDETFRGGGTESLSRVTGNGYEVYVAFNLNDLDGETWFSTIGIKLNENEYFQISYSSIPGDPAGKQTIIDFFDSIELTAAKNAP